MGSNISISCRKTERIISLEYCYSDHIQNNWYLSIFTTTHNQLHFVFKCVKYCIYSIDLFSVSRIVLELNRKNKINKKIQIMKNQLQRANFAWRNSTNTYKTVPTKRFSLYTIHTHHSQWRWRRHTFAAFQTRENIQVPLTFNQFTYLRFIILCCLKSGAKK